MLVTGPTVMLGYLGRDDLTASALHDGWFNTGDRATMDEDGFIRIVTSADEPPKPDLI